MAEEVATTEDQVRFVDCVVWTRVAHRVTCLEAVQADTTVAEEGIGVCSLVSFCWIELTVSRHLT